MQWKIRRLLVKPSTLAFTQEARRVPGFTFFDWLHGYVYARWTYLYIGIGTGEHWLARVITPLLDGIARLAPKKAASSNLTGAEKPATFAEAYHGKVMPLEAASRLVMVNEEIDLPDLEKVIPYAKARAIVMKNPDHILALECPCRSARSNPCLPLDVCLIVGDPFASFVKEHHPDRARRITPEEAVEILRAEDERGHVHHAFFKDAMLGRFYAICNCCDCCCGAMQAQRNGTPMLASSGYVCQVDDSLCVACGTCHAYCQFHALSAGDLFTVIDLERCMGCGVCVTKCPEGALALQLAPEKGIPLEIQQLLDAVQ